MPWPVTVLFHLCHDLWQLWQVILHFLTCDREYREQIWQQWQGNNQLHVLDPSEHWCISMHWTAEVKWVTHSWSKAVSSLLHTLPFCAEGFIVPEEGRMHLESFCLLACDPHRSRCASLEVHIVWVELLPPLFLTKSSSLSPVLTAVLLCLPPLFLSKSSSLSSVLTAVLLCLPPLFLTRSSLSSMLTAVLLCLPSLFLTKCLSLSSVLTAVLLYLPPLFLTRSSSVLPMLTTVSCLPSLFLTKLAAVLLCLPPLFLTKSSSLSSVLTAVLLCRLPDVFCAGGQPRSSRATL